MPYSAEALITKAYYTANIVSRDFETVTGSQISDGLDLLNALLAVKSADKRLIPYYTYSEIALTVNVGDYFIPNLVEVDPITFNIGPVRFPMQRMNRREFFGAPRVDDINSLPFSWEFEREKGGGRIRIYFLPSENFPLKFMGKYALNNVTLFQDLSLTLDNFYIEYLRYALADYLCEFNGLSLTPNSVSRLKELENIIMDVSPIDFTLEVVSSLSGSHGMNWAYINISGGYTPS